MGKPVVSNDKGTGVIQCSDIERCQSDTVAQKTVPMFACFVLNTPNTDNP